MDRFTLFGNRESGHTYKVRLMLSLCGLAHEYTEIDISLARDQRPEPFRSLASYGEVPLLLHNGRPYVQSNAILQHLAEHTGRFGGESPQRMERVREWLFWEANRIGFSLPNLRYGQKYLQQGANSDVQLMLRDRFNADIARLDDELADGRAFMLDETPSIADISLCGYMYWPEQAMVRMPPQVQGWLDRISALPGWRHPYEGAGPNA
jgi:glutathione S-transferase